MPATPVRSAFLYAAAGFSLLACGDVVVKTVAGAWPAPAIAALRFSLGALGLAGVLWWRGGARAFAMPRPAIQIGRGAALAFATLCFFSSLFLMPIADATALIFTSPVITALLSWALLRERPPAAVWPSTALAFAGVLVILRPNLLELGPAALLPLGSALGMSALMLLNRRAAGLAPALTMQFLVAACAAPILVAAAAAGHASGLRALAVPTPDWTIVARCALVAVTGSTGHWLIYRATERASAATVMPMTYSQILVALAAGWALFGDAPDAITLAGVALIVAGGLWLWRSEAPPPVVDPPD